jgi:hypothetical protein
MDRCVASKRYHLTIVLGFAVSIIRSVSKTTPIEVNPGGVRCASGMPVSLNVTTPTTIELGRSHTPPSSSRSDMTFLPVRAIW